MKITNFVGCSCVLRCCRRSSVCHQRISLYTNTHMLIAHTVSTAVRFSFVRKLKFHFIIFKYSFIYYISLRFTLNGYETIKIHYPFSHGQSWRSNGKWSQWCFHAFNPNKPASMHCTSYMGCRRNSMQNKWENRIKRTFSENNKTATQKFL